MSLLDDVLPEWHFRERHRRHVRAEPERVFAAVRDLTLAETPVAALLVRLRGMRPKRDQPIFDEMRRVGVQEYLLKGLPNTDIVAAVRRVAEV